MCTYYMLCARGPTCTYLKVPFLVVEKIESKCSIEKKVPQCYYYVCIPPHKLSNYYEIYAQRLVITITQHESLYFDSILLHSGDHCANCLSAGAIELQSVPPTCVRLYVYMRR